MVFFRLQNIHIIEFAHKSILSDYPMKCDSLPCLPRETCPVRCFLWKLSHRDVLGYLIGVRRPSNYLIRATSSELYPVRFTPWDVITIPSGLAPLDVYPVGYSFYYPIGASHWRTFYFTPMKCDSLPCLPREMSFGLSHRGEIYPVRCDSLPREVSQLPHRGCCDPLGGGNLFYFLSFPSVLRLLLSFCFLIFSNFFASGLSFPSNLFSSSSHICFLA